MIKWAVFGFVCVLTAYSLGVRLHLEEIKMAWDSRNDRIVELRSGEVQTGKIVKETSETVSLAVYGAVFEFALADIASIKNVNPVKHVSDRIFKKFITCDPEKNLLNRILSSKENGDLEEALTLMRINGLEVGKDKLHTDPEAAVRKMLGTKAMAEKKSNEARKIIERAEKGEYEKIEEITGEKLKI